ncbi:MAG: sugar phosphate isomerase/epimerase [Clostridia bacterium]|nr:sugar phosphate isomerase/epimerase [Clostridia bacterium]
MKKWQIALSSCFWGTANEENLKIMFKECAEGGIKAVEISTGDLHIAEALDWDMIKSLADENGIEIWSYHIPFAPFHKIDPCFEDEEKRQETVKIFTELAEKAAKVGVKNFVIHPSGEPNPDDRRSLRIAQSKKSFAEMAESFAKFGGRPLVEDLPRSCLGNCSEDIAEIISADERIGVIFDTNHLLKQDNIEFIKAVGNRIVSTHVSDYDFTDEKHLLPGEGKIDWPALMHALDEVGYEDPILYELSRNTTDVIARSSPLTYGDMIKNHSELMNFTAPTPHDIYKG